jgi:hypothetical protein
MFARAKVSTPLTKYLIFRAAVWLAQACPEINRPASGAVYGTEQRANR